MVFNAVSPQRIYLNEIPRLLEGKNVYVLHEISRRISDKMSMCNSQPLLLLFTAMCLSCDHVTGTCIFAYFFFLSFKVIKTAKCKIKKRSFFCYFIPVTFHLTQLSKGT